MGLQTGGVSRLVFLALAMPCLTACGTGLLTTGDADADTDVEPADGGDGGGDGGGVCDGIVCAEGQICVDGGCRVFDSCDGVECANPGEVCDPRDGACVFGAADDDVDGFTIAAGDCDDGDPAIHPGALEVCDGVDQDCDLEVDEELAPQECSTACGTGSALCVEGAWECGVPEECECTPAGSTREEACGRCGRRTMTCTAELTWSDWGACTGEGPCTPGDRDERACGNCGQETRTCRDDCQWGEWSGCRGEGMCAPGSSDFEDCNECGRRERRCSSSCAWEPWGPCEGTGSGCSWGFRCSSDGTCDCGPAPHFREVGGLCLPSCGEALSHAGLSNDGGGCCSAGCRGAEVASYDCAHCCESPPGCR